MLSRRRSARAVSRSSRDAPSAAGVSCTAASGRQAKCHSTPLILATVSLLVALVLAQSAKADDPPLAATSTSTTTVAASQSNALAGVALSGGTPGATLRVSVSTNVGTLSIGATTGLTLATGFSSWTNQAEIAFTGQLSDVNNGLASLTFNPGANQGQNANFQINAQTFVSGMAYSPDNGHYYEYVAAPTIGFVAAQAAAATKTFGGQTGYLASIPSSAINDLIASKIPGATNVWFGASAVNTAGQPVQRTWSWSNGPLASTNILQCSNLTGACTQTNGPWSLAGLWASGEPNNWSNIESAAVTNWNGAAGQWNDLSPTETGNIDGYIVEYGDQANGSSTPFTGTASASGNIAIVGAPGAPTGVAATANGNSATISWTAPVNNGGSPLTTYTVTASGGGGSCTVTPPTTSCSIGMLTPGQSYTFTVTASNAGGAGPASSPSNSVVPTVAPPQPPTSVVVIVVDPTTVEVTWTPPVDNGGENANFTVVAQPGGQTCTTTGNSCQITGLTPGQPYTFTVSAGNSAGSTAAAGVATLLPSSKPVILSAHFGKQRMLTGIFAAALIVKPPSRTPAPGQPGGPGTPGDPGKAPKQMERGTPLYVSASEPGTLNFSLTREKRGRLAGGTCRAVSNVPSASARHKPCKTFVKVRYAARGVAVEKGNNTLRFTGRMGKKRLAPGKYRVTFTLTGAAGTTSDAKTAEIVVVARR